MSESGVDLKLEGNRLFGLKDYQGALEKYSQVTIERKDMFEL